MVTLAWIVGMGIIYFRFRKKKEKARNAKSCEIS